MTESMGRLLYPFTEAADMLGVKRTTVYSLVAQGDLAQVKIGRRSLITADSLSEYVGRLVGDRHAC